MRILLSAAFVCAAFFPGPASAQEQKLPDAPGKELFQKICTVCHGADVVSALQNTREDWADIVEDMETKGADMKADDKKKIIDYLAAAFPKKAIESRPAKNQRR